jgi:glucuronate isomerase
MGGGMSKEFINDDFLLETKQAKILFHDYAGNMPIIDYHCHLSPKEIAEDKHWENITQIWLYGDHYKWRAMRSNGVAELFCTGDASDREKFDKWAETMPCLLRNPLYHWSHLELKKYFSISDCVLSPETADCIWENCNARIAEDVFSARGLIERSNVVALCTTDDPLDSLEHHKALAMNSRFGTKVYPTWRPDKGMAVENPELFNSWLNGLEDVSDISISTFSDYLEALKKRHDYFHSTGCRLSDHGIETFYAENYTEAEIETIFNKIRANNSLSSEEILKFRSAMLYEFAIMNNEKDWAQQFHYGCLRNNNSRMAKAIGPDSGFDSIGDPLTGRTMSRFFDRLDKDGKLTKTIIYNLNPCDNELVATMLGNFQTGSVPGKMQMGSGWWFLDQKNGMERQIETLSQLSLLSRFVGMLTDSRSFLSYTRHEYFRRILCNILGNDMAKGLIPDDMNLVGNMVQDICYNNAKNYFGWGADLT